MQIKDLPSSGSLVATDVLAKDASGGTTEKINGSDLASSIKTLGSLLGTSDVVNNLSTNDTTGTKPAGQQEVYQLNNLTKNTILLISKPSVSITNGSPSTPGYTDVDLTSDVGNTTLWGADVYISYNGTIYKLPYMKDDNSGYTLVEKYSGKTITLKNTAGGWGSCTLFIVAFVARS